MIGCLIMMGLVLAFPQETSSAARNAVRIWGVDVVPSLFPYMVLCRMLSSQLSRMRFPAKISAVFLGLVGGSPSGAAAIRACSMGRQMDCRTLYTFAALTGTISPMFILNTVSAWLSDPELARALLTAHLLGAAAAAMLVYRFTPSDQIRQVQAGSENAEVSPISESISSVLGVGGCIVFYSVVAEGICMLLPDAPDRLRGILHAMLEIAGGMKEVADLNGSRTFLGLASAGAFGFSGISILSQNLLFLRPYGVQLWELVSIALLRAGCSVLIMALILAIL